MDKDDDDRIAEILQDSFKFLEPKLREYNKNYNERTGFNYKISEISKLYDDRSRTAGLFNGDDGVSVLSNIQAIIDDDKISVSELSYSDYYGLMLGLWRNDGNALKYTESDETVRYVIQNLTGADAAVSSLRRLCLEMFLLGRVVNMITTLSVLIHDFTKRERSVKLNHDYLMNGDVIIKCVDALDTVKVLYEALVVGSGEEDANNMNNIEKLFLMVNNMYNKTTTSGTIMGLGVNVESIKVGLLVNKIFDNYKFLYEFKTNEKVFFGNLFGVVNEKEETETRGSRIVNLLRNPFDIEIRDDFDDGLILYVGDEETNPKTDDIGGILSGLVNITRGFYWFTDERIKKNLAGYSAAIKQSLENVEDEFRRNREKYESIRKFLGENNKKISSWFKKGLGKSLKGYNDELERKKKSNMVDVDPNSVEKSQKSVSRFFDSTSKLLSGIFPSSGVDKKYYVDPQGNVRWGSGEPREGDGDGDGDIDEDGNSRFREISDYLNGVDAESDDPNFTGVVYKGAEFIITENGKIMRSGPDSTVYYVVKENEDGSGFYIEKINKKDYDDENAITPDATPPLKKSSDDGSFNNVDVNRTSEFVLESSNTVPIDTVPTTNNANFDASVDAGADYVDVDDADVDVDADSNWINTPDADADVLDADVLDADVLDADVLDADANADVLDANANADVLDANANADVLDANAGSGADDVTKEPRDPDLNKADV